MPLPPCAKPLTRREPSWPEALLYPAYVGLGVPVRLNIVARYVERMLSAAVSAGSS